MVEYVITQKNADKNRVFAAGFSSGGCMTNTLLAIYPDVFAGGAAMPGFPVGVWPAGDHSCTQCSTANPPTLQTKTAQQWGDVARTAFAFTGTRPCVQEWAGDNDMYPFNEYMPAVASQFSNLMDLDAGSPGTGAPSGWTRTVYKDKSGNVRLEMNIGAGKPHDLTGSNLFGSVVTFLGLDKATGACGLTSGSGGSGSGGASSTGGAGGTSAGGASSTGGAGGTSTAGGSGGAPTSSGGSPTSGSAGAATSTGGASTGVGGAPSVAGSASVAGSPSNAGSASAMAGSSATAGSSGGGAASDSGCSCSTAGPPSNRSALAALIALSAMCVVSVRRRTRMTRAAR
jgi:MYXO-CTERM domain-containing protein